MILSLLNFLFSLFFTGVLAATTAPDACENGLSGESQQILVYLERLSQLKSEVDARLHPFTNPFFQAQTLDAALQVTNELSFDPHVRPSGKVQPRRTVYGRLRRLLQRVNFTQLSQVEPLIHEVTEFATSVLSKPRAQNLDLYRASVSIEALTPLLAAVTPRVEEEPEIDFDVGLIGSNKNGEQEYPEASDKAEAGTFEFPSSNDSKGEMYTAAEVNLAGVDFFIYEIYNDVSRTKRPSFQAAPLPKHKYFVAPNAVSEVVLKLHLNGKRDAAILLPPGWEPTQTDITNSAKVYITDTGQYRIKNPQGFKTISLYLIPERSPYLNTVATDWLARSFGVRDKEWPQRIQLELIDDLKREKDPLLGTRKIQDYIRSRLWYTKKQRPEKDVVDALRSERIQCTMAALSMVALVRDVLHLPARVIGGFGGSFHPSNPKTSAVRLPSVGHVQVQVYIDGKWQRFDPTPHRMAENETQDEPTEWLKNVMQQAESLYDDDTLMADDDEDDLRRNSTEGEDQREKLTKEVEEHQKQERERLREALKDASEEPLASDDYDDLTPEMRDALRFAHGSLKKDESGPPKSLLASRLYMLALRRMLDPRFDTSYGLQQYSKWRQTLRAIPGFYQFGLLVERALIGRQGTITDTLIHLKSALSAAREGKQPINLDHFFKRLVQVEDRLSAWQQVLNPEHQPVAKDIVDRLREIKASLTRLNDEGRLARGRAEKFVNDLPLYSRQIILDRYQIKEVGDNRETGILAQELGMIGKSKKEKAENLLEDFNLLRLVYSLSDFITDAVETPATLPRRTLLEDVRAKRNFAWMPAEDLSNFEDIVFLQADKSPMQNIAEGTAFRRFRQRTVMAPASTGFTQPMRVTTLAYDTSGSMAGGPERFQAALIAAFADRALSDIRHGKHCHLLHLVGFDDEVHDELPILNSEDAKKLIQGFRRNLRNRNAGTNCMNALRHQFATILKAQAENGDEPLASANIILMTDGQCDVDYDELRKLMAMVNRKTRIKFLFVALGGENEKLRLLAANLQQKVDADESYYYPLTSEQMDKFLSESKVAPQIDQRRELYSNGQVKDVPITVEQTLSYLADRVRSLQTVVAENDQPRDFDYWLRLTAGHQRASASAKDNDEKTELVKEIGHLRNTAHNLAVFRQDKELVQLVLDHVMRNFEKLLHRDLKNLNGLEFEVVKHLIKEMRAYHAGYEPN